MEKEGSDGGDGRGAQRGVGDDRLGRPTPEHFHKSRVSKQGSVSGNREYLNKEHHLLARHGYCCLLWGRRRERACLTKTSITFSVYCYTYFHCATVHILNISEFRFKWLHSTTPPYLSPKLQQKNILHFQCSLREKPKREIQMQGCKIKK